MQLSTFEQGLTDPREPRARRGWAVPCGLVLSVAVLLAGCGDGESAREVPAFPPPTQPLAATQPLAVDTPPPDYPMELACAGVGGEVVLILSLDAKGVPADVQIENRSRQPALDAAAVTAVRGWRFKPATNRGEPAPTKIRVPVKFTPPVMRPERCFAFDEEQRRAR